LVLKPNDCVEKEKKMLEISREILSVGDLNRAIATSLEERFDLG
jgi:hypothetical protein